MISHCLGVFLAEGEAIFVVGDEFAALLAGLLGVGCLANLAIRPVDPKYQSQVLSEEV